jgi:hypothetical protein
MRGLNILWLSYLDPFDSLAPKDLKIIWLSNLLTGRTWGRLLQKCVLHITFDIYIFITVTGSIPLPVLLVGITWPVVNA